MTKKLISMLLVVTMAAFMSMTVFAGPTDGVSAPSGSTAASEGTAHEDASGTEEEQEPGISLGSAIASTGIGETDQFLASITKPEGNDNVYKKSYYICGKSDLTDVEVVLAVYDTDADAYREYATTDGDSRWEIGSFGLFSKEILLKEGSNKLKIIVYKKSEADSLKPDVNLQISYFTITVRKETVKDLIVKSIVDITTTFNKIFNKN